LRRIAAADPASHCDAQCYPRGRFRHGAMPIKSPRCDLRPKRTIGTIIWRATSLLRARPSRPRPYYTTPRQRFWTHFGPEQGHQQVEKKKARY